VLAASRARVSRIAGSTFRRNLLTTGAAGVAVYALGLVTGPILARSLGPAGRGELAAVLVPADLLYLGLAFGLPPAAAYLHREFGRGTLFATSTLFGLAVGVPLVVCLWPVLPHYYGNHQPATLFWAYVFLSAAPLSVGAVTALNLIWADGADLRWNLCRVTPIVVTALLVVALSVTARLTVWTGLAASFTGSFATTVLLITVAVRWRSLRVSLRTLRSQLSYGARVAVGTVADTVTARLDQALLVAMVPAAELGLYAVAVSAAGVSSPLSSSLGLALFPELRRGGDSDAARRRRAARALAAVLASSMAVAAVLAVFGPWLLARLFGPGFAPAATPLRLLLLGQIANDATQPLTARLLAANRPGTASQASAIAAVLTVAGVPLLVPTFGINGAAAATTFSYLTRFCFVAIAVHRRSSPRSADPAAVQVTVTGGERSVVGRHRS
jgi:O-antigen/teichoic acid export membrane protein